MDIVLYKNSSVFIGTDPTIFSLGRKCFSEMEANFLKYLTKMWKNIKFWKPEWISCFECPFANKNFENLPEVDLYVLKIQSS